MPAALMKKLSDAYSTPQKATESQRGLELRKFFAPSESLSDLDDAGFNGSLNDDGALDAFVECVVWRLDGVRAVVSLIDRQTQYFIAGAIRSRAETKDINAYQDDLEYDPQWFGCSTVPTPGGLCENTLALESVLDDYPCFVVTDLLEDDRFASLPVVDGSVASFRFYAGTPITTKHGVNIGSLFLFDDRPRHLGLSLEHRKFIRKTAENIMNHLETKREAAERRRITLMSQGIALFLEKASQVSNVIEDDTDIDSRTPEPLTEDYDKEDDEPHNVKDKDAPGNKAHEKAAVETKDKVFDQIRVALDHAADILRDSLELTKGGVVFLDTTLGHTETGIDTAYKDQSPDIGAAVETHDRRHDRKQSRPQIHPLTGSSRSHSFQSQKSSNSERSKSAKVLAMSTAEVAEWNHSSWVLDGKTLASFIDAYPKGNIWYLDGDGYFSSLEQVKENENAPQVSPTERRSSVTSIDTKKRAEAILLSQVFDKARQIIFLPLWDARAQRWYSGCFVWSQSAVPVFTVESEVSYLAAFTNSVMVEISRLDAIAANKMKSDFISSISHEFRSPLHGILASAEFISESELTSVQAEFISTIQNCGVTLLDTINHLLDYSKINSFEKISASDGNAGIEGSTAALGELSEVCNLALVCEEVVDGMIAANSFQAKASSDVMNTDANQAFKSEILGVSFPGGSGLVDIILDIEERDWHYNFQPGALRRILMNIFGNAQKYTTKGFIFVQIRVTEQVNDQREDHTDGSFWLSIKVKDTGRGMNSEFMERKLFHPFSQEDSFAPGVGLGMSIIWSIINQLGGNIDVRSEIGKGTEVQVTLPLRRVESSTDALEDQIRSPLKKAQECIQSAKRLASGNTVALWKAATYHERMATKALAWESITNYCTKWLGFAVVEMEDGLVPSNATMIITDRLKFSEELASNAVEAKCGVLIICDDITPVVRNGNEQRRKVVKIRSPVGPLKLSRSVMSLLRQSEQLKSAVEPKDDTALTDMTEKIPFVEDILKRQTGIGKSSSTAFRDEPTVTELSISSDARSLSAATLAPRSMTDSLADATMSLKISPPPSKSEPRSPKVGSSVAASQPAAKAATATTATTTAQLEGAPSTGSLQRSRDDGLRILIVDDNELNLQLLQRYLKKRRQDSITAARNGIEAVAAVQHAPPEEPFDVIFMDLSMPEMDGFEATRHIRRFERERDQLGTKEANPKSDNGGKDDDAWTLAGEVDGRFASVSAPYLDSGESAVGGGRKEATTTTATTSEASELEGSSEKKSVVEENEEQAARPLLPAAKKQPRYALMIALTGLASRRDRDEAKECGLDDFMTKPIAFGKIGETLKRLAEAKL